MLAAADVGATAAASAQHRIVGLGMITLAATDAAYVSAPVCAAAAAFISL